VDLMQ